jgi:hypothetical protein
VLGVEEGIDLGGQLRLGLGVAVMGILQEFAKVEAVSLVGLDI